MALSRYQAFQEKVSKSFADIESRFKNDFKCARGCHECCKPALTVNSLEKASIQSFLEKNPEQVELIKKLAQDNPWKGKRCSFLDASGSCTIYEVRPIVCRSHGAPLQFRDPESKDFEKAMRYRDVCPLNFKDKKIENLSLNDILNLDTINTLLALLNQKYCQEMGTDSSERFVLRLEMLAPSK